MFKHILKLIKAQGKSNAWVFMELLIVFILLWWSIDATLMQGITALQPEGFSVDNVCKVTLAVRPRTSASYVNYQEGSEEVGKNYLRIIERLKMHPDVGTVAFFGPHSAPFNYSSNSRTCWNDTVSAVNSLRYTVTPDYFRVFDIHAVDGGSPDLLADALADGWVVSRTLEEKLVDGAHLQGKRLAWDNKGDSTTYRVNGITVPIKKQGFDQPRPVVFTLLTEKDLYEADERELGQMQIAFRLRSGVTGSSDYAASFKTEMKQSLAAGNFWLADVQYYPDIRGKFLDNTMQVNGQRLNIAVNAFLLVNVFLAVIGTFWFRVNRRKGELGLRMAVGSSRRTIRQLVVGEGLLILTIVSIPALLLCLNMAYADMLSTVVMKVTFGRLLVVSLLTWGILAGIIFLATWYPSRKASRLEPAEALHYE
ncbi:ABC transporter permease [Parabacteroides hominis]|jgi:hypothetical protein|uniref:FtsX-like permease family protein n=1 Tax=Parabacteroides hominis TaxID=2763057 RepID=A0ABR7DJG5_9BACT|nr:FtsX-like permease family protein [Parabacteroides hominis]MBC5631536.1 FtsX-like permease family protein [Parabacteroides hominis]MBD9166568.1 FtsX-like permease family protein [Parabacteroides johnsonii]MBD9166593.1 FtsX-like permease family protein [Parabacteroides johnsonii]